jgi:hypothetical protein
LFIVLSDFDPEIRSDLLAFTLDVSVTEDFHCIFQVDCVNGVAFAGVGDSDVLSFYHGVLLSFSTLIITRGLDMHNRKIIFLCSNQLNL